MVDLTIEQLKELYGHHWVEDEGEEVWVESAEDSWKPDFSKWVAIPQDDNPEQWAISPKVFWDANGFIPDWCIGFSVPGFYEASEHTLTPKMSQHEPRKALLAMGFTIIDDPVWGWDR